MIFKNYLKSAGAAAMLCGLLAAPAFAQMANSGTANGNGSGNNMGSAPMGTNAAMPNGNTTMANNNSSMNHGGPSGTLEKTHGLWRAGAVNGADVYDSSGKQIGMIDNLLISSSGKVTDAVITVGGIAGVGGKMVEVPFKKLEFKQSNTGNGGNGGSNMQASSGTNSQMDYSIVLPNQTEDSLKAMPTFSYDNS